MPFTGFFREFSYGISGRIPSLLCGKDRGRAGRPKRESSSVKKETPSRRRRRASFDSGSQGSSSSGLGPPTGAALAPAPPLPPGPPPGPPRGVPFPSSRGKESRASRLPFPSSSSTAASVPPLGPSPYGRVRAPAGATTFGGGGPGLRRVRGGEPRGPGEPEAPRVGGGSQAGGGIRYGARSGSREGRGRGAMTRGR